MPLVPHRLILLPELLESVRVSVRVRLGLGLGMIVGSATAQLIDRWPLLPAPPPYISYIFYISTGEWGGAGVREVNDGWVTFRRPARRTTRGSPACSAGPCVGRFAHRLGRLPRRPRCFRGAERQEQVRPYVHMHQWIVRERFLEKRDGTSSLTVASL